MNGNIVKLHNKLRYNLKGNIVNLHNKVRYYINVEIKKYTMDFLNEEVLSDRETYMNNNKLEGLLTANPGLLSEITVIDTEGEVVASSDPDRIGTNFFDDESRAAFRCLFEGEDY